MATADEKWPAQTTRRRPEPAKSGQMTRRARSRRNRSFMPTTTKRNSSRPGAAGNAKARLVTGDRRKVARAQQPVVAEAKRDRREHRDRQQFGRSDPGAGPEYIGGQVREADRRGGVAPTDRDRQPCDERPAEHRGRASQAAPGAPTPARASALIRRMLADLGSAAAEAARQKSRAQPP